MQEMLRSNLGLPVSIYPVCQHGTLHLKILFDTSIVLLLAFKLNLEDEKMELYFAENICMFIWNSKFCQ